MRLRILPLWILLAARHAAAQPPAPPAAPQTPPGLQIVASADPAQATVGDPIRVNFELVLPKDYQVRFPALNSQLGDFVILESHPGPALPDDEPAPPRSEGSAPAEGKTRYRARLVVALYRTGEFEFPSLPLLARDAEGKEHALSSPAVRIQIRSVLTEKDQNLKDLRKQAEIHEPVRWVLWLAVALLLALLAALAWWRWRRRRAAPDLRLPARPQMDPLSRAEADLRDLLARRLLEEGFVKQFYVALSEIAKKILEAGYGIQTVEKTSSEILESLQNGARLASTEDLLRIQELLVACDLVKFAKHAPTGSENEAAVNNTMRVLEACKKARHAPPDAAPEPITELS